MPYVRPVKAKSGRRRFSSFTCRGRGRGTSSTSGQAHDEAGLEPGLGVQPAGGPVPVPSSRRAPAGRPQALTWSGATRSAGRQLAHDLFRRVPLPRGYVDMRAILPATRAARLSTDVDLVIHAPVADPPDPEGRIGISAAVAGQRPAQALGVVFAVHRDDDRPGASPDPPALGGKMPGQRYRFAV